MPCGAAVSLTSAAEQALARLEMFGIKLGLDAIRTLLGALGEPQRRYPVVLVAGTNGKGSTSALLDAIACHAGLRVGLYTSPHLESPRERVRVDGRAVPADELSDAVLASVAAAERALPSPPTYFEAMTAAACRVFAARGVDLAVLEVGMGGRLDATNACDPVLSVITPIGLDHQQYLGTTLAEIAREKAGILRARTSAAIWTPAPDADAALVAAGAAVGADLERVHATTRARTLGARGLAGQTLAVETPNERYELETHLLGAHQLGNVALAVRCAELLRAQGFAMSHAAIERGVRSARWPGRLEPVRLGDGRTVLFDGAHNPDGVTALATFLETLDQPFDLLFGALADKDLERMLPPLARKAREVTLTTVPSPRTAAAAELAHLLGVRPAAVEEDPPAALARALRPGPTELLVVCGSLYLVGALRAELTRTHGVPVPAAELALC
jgi:dihydrofolate synthase/folylpolyglutamate synthase